MDKNIISFLEHLFYHSINYRLSNCKSWLEIKISNTISFFWNYNICFFNSGKIIPFGLGKIQFFYNGTISINELGLKLLSLACGAGGVATFLLVLVVIAIRNDIF